MDREIEAVKKEYKENQEAKHEKGKRIDKLNDLMSKEDEENRRDMRAKEDQVNATPGRTWK